MWLLSSAPRYWKVTLIRVEVMLILPPFEKGPFGVEAPVILTKGAAACAGWKVIEEAITVTIRKKVRVYL